MTTGSGHTILISPIGAWAAELLEPIGKMIRMTFGFPTEILPLLDDLAFAFDPERDQYHSTSILGRLQDAAPPQALKVLALAEVDLFIPILTHVYGEAQLGGKACIVSAFRLNEGPAGFHWQKKLAERLVKEAVHELGHTFNLRHCREAGCTMHYCRSEADVDRKSDQLCRYCRVLLADVLRRLRRQPAP